MTLKLGMRHWLLKYYQICSNDDPVLTLTYFTARSDLVPFVFLYGKMLLKVVDFQEAVEAFEVNIGIHIVK